MSTTTEMHPLLRLRVERDDLFDAAEQALCDNRFHLADVCRRLAELLAELDLDGPAEGQMLLGAKTYLLYVQAINDILAANDLISDSPEVVAVRGTAAAVLGLLVGAVEPLR